MAINAFTYPDLTNRTTYPNPSNTATNIGNQLTNAMKAVTNQLNSEVTNKLAAITDGAAGADQIGATLIVNGATNTVQAQMEAIYAAAVNAIVGSIPDGSIEDIKLTANAGAINSRVVNNATNIGLLQTSVNTINTLRVRRYLDIMYEG